LLAQIVRQQIVFYLVDGSLGFMSNLFETNPNQYGRTNMIPDDSCLSALATFDTGHLLGFMVKLLDLPTKVAHVLYDLRVVLHHLVCDDIVCALGRQHYSENFHLMFSRKTFDLDDLAMLFFCFGPFQAIDVLIGL